MLLYFWEFSVLPAEMDNFKKAFHDINVFNKNLPDNTQFIGVYQNFFGGDHEFPFKILFSVPSLTIFESCFSSEGLRFFHQEISKYIDKNKPLRNSLLSGIDPWPWKTN